MQKLVFLFISLIAISVFAKTDGVGKNRTKPVRTVAQNISQSHLEKIVSLMNKAGINPNKLSSQYISQNDCAALVSKNDITSATESEGVIDFAGKFMCFPAKNDSPAVGIINFKGKISFDHLNELSFSGALDSSD